MTELVAAEPPLIPIFGHRFLIDHAPRPVLSSWEPMSAAGPLGAFVVCQCRWKVGSRFSAKAWMPSAASSEAKSPATASRSRAKPRSSGERSRS